MLVAEFGREEVSGRRPPGGLHIRQLTDELLRVQQLPEVWPVARPQILDPARALHLRLEGVVQFKEYNAQAVHVTFEVDLKQQ